jgi:hypothetical protein
MSISDYKRCRFVGRLGAIRLPSTAEKGTIHAQFTSDSRHGAEAGILKRMLTLRKAYSSQERGFSCAWVAWGCVITYEKSELFASSPFVRFYYCSFTFA